MQNKNSSLYYVILIPAILEIDTSDMQSQNKPASSSSIFCQHVVHTTLWYKYMSEGKKDYDLYCQELGSFTFSKLCCNQ